MVVQVVSGGPVGARVVTPQIARDQLALLDAQCARVDALILVLTVIALATVRSLITEYYRDESGGQLICAIMVTGIIAFELNALFRGAFPQSLRAERSLIDEWSITQRTPQQFRTDYLEVSEEALLDDLSRQIHDRAHALVVKQEESRKAFIAMLASIPFAVALLLFK